MTDDGQAQRNPNASTMPPPLPVAALHRVDSDAWGRPQGVLGYAGPIGVRRPVVVRILAILGFVLAAWLVYLGLRGLDQAARLAELWSSLASAPDSPIGMFLRRLVALVRAESVGDLVVAGCLIAVGVGGVRWAAWAWRANLIYAAAHLAWIILIWTTYFLWVVPAAGDTRKGGAVTLRMIASPALQAVVPVLILTFYPSRAVRRGFGRAVA